MMTQQNRWARRILALLLVCVTATAWAQGSFGIEGDWKYQYDGSRYWLAEYLGTAAEVTTPVTVNGNKVTIIASRCFAEKQTLLTSVTVSEGIREIDRSVFINCTKLTSVSLPNSLQTLGDASFKNCVSLESFTLPNQLTSIERETFSDCTSLATVTLPSSLASIGVKAFLNCSTLTSITIPSSVTVIEEEAFYNTGLTDVWFEGSKGQWDNVTKGNDALLSKKLSVTTHWRCTATFNMMGHGTAPAAQTIWNGNTLTQPTDPTEQGWTFDGWSSNEECTQSFDFSSSIDDNVIIYAKWTARTDNVVAFDTNGKGTAIASQTLTTGQTVTEPDVQFYHNDTDGKDYCLESWYTDADCTAAYDFATPVDHSFTLYAKWIEAGHFTLTAGEGGTVTLTDAKGRTLIADGTFFPGQCTLTVTPLSGYSFTGSYMLIDRSMGYGETAQPIGGSNTLSIPIDLTTMDLDLNVTFSKITTYQVFVTTTTGSGATAGTFTLADKNGNSYTNGETLKKVNDGSETFWNNDYDLTLTVAPDIGQNCAMTIENNGVTTYVEANMKSYTFEPKGSITIKLYFFKKIDATMLLNLKDADSDNSKTLTGKNNGKPYTAQINGRTLWKDGKWNTLCLPFGLKTLDGTPLEGAMVMYLNTTYKKNGIYQTRFDEESGTLNLYFTTVTSIEAGQPYIVKWETGDPIESPMFYGVFITATEPASVTSNDGKVSFCGSYDYKEYTTENSSILFLGENNALYFPQPSGGQNPSIGACRAYFQLNGISAADPNLARRFVLNFEDSETTGIKSIENGKLKIENEAGAWYDLSGRRLSGKPTRPGIYIENGRKHVIK